MAFENKGALAATVVVAASDSLNKGAANIICNGVNDQVQIQEAIDALPAGGGKVLLLDGTYLLEARVDIIVDNVELSGSGPNTILYVADGRGNDTNAIRVFEASKVIIHHLAVNGNYTNQVEGAPRPNFEHTQTNILFWDSTYCEIYDCVVFNSIQNGISSFESSAHIRVDRNYTYDNQWVNICVFTFNAGKIPDGIVISENYLLNGGGIEYYQAINGIISNNLVKNNAGSAIAVTTDAKFVTVVGNSLINPGAQGIFITGASYVSCTANVIYEASYGVRVANSSYHCAIQSNIIYATTAGDKGIHIDSSSHISCGENAIEVPSNAVDIDSSSNVSCVGNVVYEAVYGVKVTSSSHCGIESNVMYEAATSRGIYLDEANYCSIVGNVIYNPGKTAITIYGSSWNSVVGNLALDTLATYTGFWLGTKDSTGSCHNVVEDNIIYSTTQNYGISESAPTDDYNIISRNQIGGATIENLHIEGTHTIAYERQYDTFEDVLASSANLIVNAQNFVNGAIALTGSQPNYPRGLVFAITAGVTGYTLTVVGTNGKGQTITEVFTFAVHGLAFSSNNAFDHVTSITLADRAGAAATIDVGIDGRLGLMNVIYETSDVWKITKNLAKQVVAGAQVDVDYDTYNMAAAIGIAANDDFVIWYRSNLNILS